MTKTKIHLKQADTFLKRFRGLMFTRPLPPDECLLITPCSSVHTFFMRYALDLIFMDADNQIIKMIENARPHRPIFFCSSAKSVIEATAGFIKRNNITMSSQLSVGKQSLDIV